MRIQKPQKRLYYSLRQISEMLEIPAETIKGWEEAIPRLKPYRNRAGNRYYTEKDIILLLQIKELTVEEKLTPPQIAERLNSTPIKEEEKDLLELKRQLAEIRLELREILALLES